MAIKGNPVGLARALLWEIVPSGTYVGQCSGQQASLTAGTASGAYVIDDLHDSPFAFTPPADVPVEGGDKVITTVSFGGGGLSPFDVIAPSVDTVQANLVGGSNVNTTNTLVQVEGYNLNRTSPRVMGFAAQQKFRTSTGLDYFLTRIIPRASVIYRPGTMVYRAVSNSSLRISPIKSTKAIDGQSFGSAGLNLGLEADTSDFYDYMSANPVHFMAFKQDASATTFTTTYKPLSTVITLNATPNAFAIGGTPTALASLTLAGLATLAAAGTTGIFDSLIYETNYVPS